jgi:3-hydroxyacyl-CoA dehydrogenase/enoyl-CoA hydratase/3-hydroxybutyryl-CoA epimerase
VVAHPDLVDAAVLFGAGFPPFRGGPLTYARARGVAAVVARLNELAARYGARFQPDAGWHMLAGSKAA